jgi:membrane-associated phospholipid phosphatase
MTLAVLLIVATLFGLAAGAIAWRWDGRAGAPRTEQAVARSRWARRLDPRATTGLALTLAFAVIVLGGVLLAVLAYLVRGNTEVVRIDSGVAEWGDRNASGLATDVLTAISHVGEPPVVIALAALVAIAETIRMRSRWVIPFMALVVAGNGLITTTVKELADRARPPLNPIAETLGPSFPSGHSSWSAAFFAATALLATRGRSRRARTLIAGACAAAAVSIAATRVLLDVHWLSDVIAGLAVGSAWFCVCAIACGGRLLRFGAPAEEAGRASAVRGGPSASGASAAPAGENTPRPPSRAPVGDDPGRGRHVASRPDGAARDRRA